MKILVIRFRQIGDAILATPLLSTLHRRYPDAEIDFVLNARIAPLFEGHPAIHRIITFTDDERHNTWRYIKKVWQTVRRTRYDAIIDMRSTINTLLFPLFSLRSHWRIGIRKPYSWGVMNRRYAQCRDNESMIDFNLQLAEPLLEALTDDEARQIPADRNLSLGIGQQEIDDFRSYMQEQGVDFGRPVLLVGVTAKLENKTWPEAYMTETLALLRNTFPQVQLIFNYAPGKEAEHARRIYASLLTLSPETAHSGSVFLNVEAKSPRQLAAMAASCTAYFGNEGGARHIVHAMRRPSMVICSPKASKRKWLPTDTDIPAKGIAASDIADTKGLTYEQQYRLITVERVWTELQPFIHEILSLG